MKLTQENYYSQEASQRWLSVSQFNEFVGTPAFLGCEARGMAKLRKEWKEEASPALLIGSYVDEVLTGGNLGKFKENLTDEERSVLFLKNGGLSANGKTAEAVIERAKRDEYFMKFLEGKHQVIYSFKIQGVEWKCKLDILHHGLMIVDLKTTRNIREQIWTEAGKTNFINAYGYLRQGAVYQQAHFFNEREMLPFYLAVVSKEKFNDIEIIKIPQNLLDEAFDAILQHQNHIVDVKNGKIEPERCEICDYCKFTRKLKKPISYFDL